MESEVTIWDTQKCYFGSRRAVTLGLDFKLRKSGYYMQDKNPSKAEASTTALSRPSIRCTGRMSQRPGLFQKKMEQSAAFHPEILQQA